MTALKAFRRHLGVLVLSLLALGLVIPGSAAHGTAAGGPPGVTQAEDLALQGNAPQGGGSPVPGGPGYVVLNGFDFKPYNASVGYQFSAMLLKNPSAASANYYASLHLPQGVTITQVVAYFVDNDSGSNMDVGVDLMVCNDFSTTATYMSMLTSSSVAASPTVSYITTAIITNPVVNNAAYTYLVQAYLPPSTNVGLLVVRVDYGYQTLLPSVVK